MKLATILFCLIAGTFTAFGQMEGNPENWCREGFFTRYSKEFSRGTVKGGKGTRIYFYGDDRDNCPGNDCRQKAYLVPGNEVVVNRTRNGFACAWYSPARGRPTIGWLKETDLAISKLTPGSYRAWLGEWKYGENGIEFTENKLAGYLNVTGNATWIGANPGQVHVGEIDGRYEPKNGVIEYSDGTDEYDCRATLRLLGTYLIVADNLKCGGMNVSFSGVYRRRR